MGIPAALWLSEGHWPLNCRGWGLDSCPPLPSGKPGNCLPEEDSGNGNRIDTGFSAEKAMAPHSSTLAWKIPWMEEPGRLWPYHGVTEDRTRLSDFTFTFHLHALEKEMATYSSVLALRIPGMGEPGGLTSTGSHRVRYDWSDLAAAAADFSEPELTGGLAICYVRYIEPWFFVGNGLAVCYERYTELWCFVASCLRNQPRWTTEFLVQLILLC